MMTDRTAKLRLDCLELWYYVFDILLYFISTEVSNLVVS